MTTENWLHLEGELGLEREQTGKRNNEAKTKVLIKPQCLVDNSEFKGEKSPNVPVSGQENRFSCSVGSQEAANLEEETSPRSKGSTLGG